MSLVSGTGTLVLPTNKRAYKSDDSEAGLRIGEV